MTPNQHFVSVALPNPIESDYEITQIDGEVPRDIFGALLRNGPNQQVLPAVGSEAMAFFEGDGMVRRIAFENGGSFAIAATRSREPPARATARKAPSATRLVMEGRWE